jgi:hypothetical protein
MPRRLVLFVVLLAALAIGGGDQRAAAQAAAKIEEFYGHYSGQGIAKDRDSVVFDHAIRILDTTIAPAADGAFTVKWLTVTRESDGRTARRASQELTLKPASRPGIFAAVNNGDPVAGGASSWAEIEGRTLIVNVFTVQANGRGNWAIYERKLTGDGIELTFRRVEAAGTARIVYGKLKKQKPTQ